MKIVKICGIGKEFEDFSSMICETFPLLPGKKDWSSVLKELSKNFSKYTEGNKSCNILQTQKNIYNTEQQIKDDKNKNICYEKEYDIPWEVDCLEDILENEVYPLVKKGDIIEICGAISENPTVREKIKKSISEHIKNKNADCKKIELICSYKQGFSWVDEVVLPNLQTLAQKHKIEKIVIEFKPFLKNDAQEWADEDGATPSYKNLGKTDPDAWLDLPIRFLQELYPIDDVISKKLDIKRNNIQFLSYQGDEDITYKLVAIGDGGEEIAKYNYKAKYSERPFLDSFPEMGKVHPSTGYISVAINGKNIVDRRIASDVENIWNIYQKEVLMDCKNYIKSKHETKITAGKQPFFSELRLEISASEPNFRLNIREDMISSLNALHEDMYFVGMDFFTNYGMRKSKEFFDAPGLILPVIKEIYGKPKFKVTLFDKNKEPISKENRVDVKLNIDEISFENNLLNIHIDAEFKLDKIENKYVATDYVDKVLKTKKDNEILITTLVKQLENEISQQRLHFLNINKLILRCEEKEFIVKVNNSIPIEKDFKIEDINIYENSVIGYEEYIDIIEKLKRVKGISVFKVAKSYLGRDIYAIEFVNENIGGYTSRVKRLTNYPSEFINCRHHANEVSATNAAFMLVKELLTNEKYKDIASKLNLVIVPFENADGAEIHYELQKDNPNWKLHVSRFNALGKEFASEYFKEETVHAEAECFKNIYKMYIPDVIVDNHGVPSHEWEQQFSGYTSPSYKGFWLPRALLYGYYWTVNDEKFKNNILFSKAVEKVVAENINKDEEIRDLNMDWADRFEKYAHAWLPKLFPANYYDGMINYWIETEQSLNKNYPSQKFPWLTTTCYTSEVADETAQGKYLYLCARTHVLHNLSIIDLLMNSMSHYERCIETNFEDAHENYIKTVKFTRLRPILPKL